MEHKIGEKYLWKFSSKNLVVVTITKSSEEPQIFAAMFKKDNPHWPSYEYYGENTHDNGELYVGFPLDYIKANLMPYDELSKLLYMD